MPLTTLCNVWSCALGGSTDAQQPVQLLRVMHALCTCPDAHGSLNGRHALCLVLEDQTCVHDSSEGLAGAARASAARASAARASQRPPGALGAGFRPPTPWCEASPMYSMYSTASLTRAPQCQASGASLLPASSVIPGGPTRPGWPSAPDPAHDERSHRALHLPPEIPWQQDAAYPPYPACGAS